MNVKELIEKSGFKVINEGDNLDREISGVFCCDLLSIAMSRCSAGAAWVTVMSNINTLAVASLSDAAVVILAEGVRADSMMVARAAQQGISLLSTELPVFEAALKIFENIL